MDSLGQEPAAFPYKGQSVSGFGSVQPHPSPGLSKSVWEQQRLCVQDGRLRSNKTAAGRAFQLPIDRACQEVLSPPHSSIIEKKKFSCLVVHRHRLPSFTGAEVHHIEKEKWQGFTVVDISVAAASFLCGCAQQTMGVVAVRLTLSPRDITAMKKVVTGHSKLNGRHSLYCALSLYLNEYTDGLSSGVFPLF